MTPSEQWVVDDDELTQLALAADPDQAIPADAVPWAEHMAQSEGDETALLPAWYMPAPAVGSRRIGRRRTAVVGLLVVALLAVNAVGLCVTNGQLEIAW